MKKNNLLLICMLLVGLTSVFSMCPAKKAQTQEQKTANPCPPAKPGN